MLNAVLDGEHMNIENNLDCLVGDGLPRSAGTFLRTVCFFGYAGARFPAKKPRFHNNDRPFQRECSHMSLSLTQDSDSQPDTALFSEN